MTEETIFIAALERSTSTERKAFLDEACQGDTVLRQQVEALLDSHEQAGSFLGESVPDRLACQLGSTSLHGGKQPLDFLTPSDKPESLGRLGHYEVQEIIGSGGMGVVLRGVDERLHRVVAIKVLAAQLATNAAARQRFTREARAAAAVSHDHVVTVHGVDEASGLPYLVMQYVGGISLQERIDRSGPLALHEVLRIGMQTAAGLAAAHAQGLVHRDIKPANILLENGVERVKITDFGLAHAVDDVRTTQPGTVIGTPEYMSPEQARGEKVDHRSDLFSLGCVLYTMCAGRPPFRAESTVAIIRRVCEDTPRPLSEINSEIPVWLIAVIDRLIAKDPAERFQSAAEGAELLSQFLAHVQQPAAVPLPAGWNNLVQPASDHRRVQSTDHRSATALHRYWTVATAIVLLIGVGLALAESTGVTHVAASVIRIVRGDGTLVVEVDDPNIQVLIDGEELVITGAGPKELRLRPGQHELQTVKGGKPTDTKLITITRDGRQVVKVAREVSDAVSSVPVTRQVWAKAADNSGDISRDGRYLAFVDWDTGDLAIRDLTTGQNRRLTNKGSWSKSGEFARWPRFSADGKRLAYAWYVEDSKKAYTELRVIGAEGGEPKVLQSNASGTPEPCGWTANGKSILATLHVKDVLQLVLIDTADGTQRLIKSFASRRDRIGSIALAPDGRTVAISRASELSTSNRDIFLIDVTTGQEIRATSDATDADVLCWTPDGQRLLVTMRRQGTWDAWMIPVADGKPVGEPKLVKADLGTIVPVGMTITGTFYYGVSFGGPSIFTAALNLENGTATAMPLPGEKLSIMDRLNQPRWSPDGRYLAYKSNLPGRMQEIRIVSMEGGPTRVLQPDVRFLTSAYWSPDGRSFIATAQKELGRSGVYEIDARTGDVTAIVEPEHVGSIAPGHSPRWSPDRRGIYYGKGKGIVYRDVQTKSEREIVSPDESNFAYLNFDLSPDGRQLAIAGREQETRAAILQLFPINGGAPRELLRTKESAQIGPVTWTPDGRFVLFVLHGADDKEKGLSYISADGGQPRRLEISGVEAKTIQNVSIHPDGKQLALGTFGYHQNEIWAMENFLPPLKDSAATAAAATSSGTSQSAAAAGSAPPVAASRESSASEGPSMHLVWGADRLFNTGSSSPDGKYLAYGDLRSNEVAVRDLATGTSRLITQRDHPEYGVFPIFSPDSRQIAFSWVRKDRVMELRTIGIDGTGLRVLFPNQDNEFQSLVPWDWSADGRTIVASASKGGAGQIALISATDGSLRVLKTLDLSAPGKMCFSPDGRYVACSLNVDKSSRQRDIFLLATDGSSEAPLVENPGDDVVLGWTPDGKRLLFASDRTGTTGAWAIALADGKPVGKVELVRPGLGPIVPLGFTHSGDLYYVLHSQGTDVYTATLDLETGKVLTPPALAIERGEGSNGAPDWSPDGRFLACASWRFGESPLFYIRPAESTEVRELRPKLKQFSEISLFWSPDGRALIGAGSDAEGQEGVLRIDVQTGAVTMLLPRDVLLAGEVAKRSNFLSHPLMAPDGKELIFQSISEDQGRRILRHNLDTGAEQELYRYAGSGGWALSPDGRQLVIAEMPRPTPAPVPRSHNSPQILTFGRGHALKLIPATGGEPRELAKADGIVGALAWTPDGRHIIFQRLLKQRAELWRVAATGGEPEKLDATLPPMAPLSIHPDGRRILYAAQTRAAKTEVWVLKNFLPPAKASDATATDSAAEKAKPSPEVKP